MSPSTDGPFKIATDFDAHPNSFSDTVTSSGIAVHYLNRTILTAHILLKLKMSREVALTDKIAIYTPSSGIASKLLWVENGPVYRLIRTDTTNLDRNGPHTRGLSALLSAIVYFSHINFRFAPDNTGKRPTRSNPLLSDIVLTVTGVPPAEPDLAKDFKTMVSNLERLIACAPSSAQAKTGVIVPYFWDKRIQFRHVPFVVSRPVFL